MWLERAAGIQTSRPARGWVMIGLSHINHFQGRFADSEVWSMDAMRFAGDGAVEADNAWILAFGRLMQAFVRFESGDHQRAAELALQACDLVNLRFAAPLMILGNIALLGGDHDRAQALYDEAIGNCRWGKDAWALGIVLPVGAGLRIVQGRFDEAHAMASEAIGYMSRLEDGRGVAWCVDVFAALHSASGDMEGAARLWGAADGLLESVGGSLNPETRWIP